MGDIADQIINGDMCEYCGDYLGPGDGYPRLCGGCNLENLKENFKRRKRK